MNGLIQFLEICKKNFKILFRSWSTFIFLILGPFALMIIIGLIYSNTGVEQIQIGLHGNAQLVDPLAEQFGGAFKVKTYETIQRCRTDLEFGITSVCVELGNNTNISDEGITGEVLIHYDNSRAVLSATLVDYLKERFGAQAKDITQTGVESIFTNIAQLGTFLDQSTLEVNSFIEQTDTLQVQLQNFTTRLVDARNSFAPTYAELVRLNQQIENQSLDANTVSYRLDAIQDDMADVQTQIAEAQSLINREQENLGNVESKLNEAIGVVEDLKEREDLTPESRDLINQIDVAGAKQILGLYKIQEVQQELTNIDEELKVVDNQLKTYSATLGGSEGEIISRIDQLQILTQQAGELSALIEGAITFSNTTQQQLAGSSESLRTFSESIDQAAADIAQFNMSQTESLLNPILTTEKPLLQSTPQIVLLYPIVIPIITIFVCILFANIIVINEIYDSARMRSFILPVKEYVFLLGFFTTNLVVTMCQICIIFVISEFQLGVPIFQNFWSIFIVTLILASIFVMIGMLIAYATKTKEISVLASTFLTLGLFFFSDLFFPVEMMAPWISVLVRLNPLVLGEEIFRRVIFYNIPLWESWIQMLCLCGYLLITTLAVYVILKNKRYTV